MAKNIAIGILGVIVLILSILGISKYKENNSIDIGLGIGKAGLGTGKYKNSGGGFNIGGGSKAKTKKGSYVKCYATEKEMFEVIYFEFKNDKVSSDLVQIEYGGTVESSQINKYGKSYIENSLIKYVCARDLEKSLCGNVKVSWSGNKVTMTSAMDASVNFRTSLKGYTFEQLKNKLFAGEYSGVNGTCEKVSKAPIYSTKLDPAGTYYNKVYKDEDNTGNKLESSKSGNNSTNKGTGNNSSNTGTGNSKTGTGSGTVTTQPVEKLCNPSQVYVKSTSIIKIDNNYVVDMDVVNKQGKSCKINYVNIIVKDKLGKEIGDYTYKYNDIIAKDANVTLEYYPKVNLTNADQTKTECAINKMVN